MNSTTRHASPVFILMLATALLAARAGMAQHASHLSSYLNSSSYHRAGSVTLTSTIGGPVANAERGVISLSQGFAPVNGAMTTRARPGFLQVSNSSKATHTGPTHPQTSKYFHGNAHAEFEDYLTFTSNDPSRPVWSGVTLRTRWRRSGTITYQDSEVPEDWGGKRPSGQVTYSFKAMTDSFAAGRGRGQYAAETYQMGDLTPLQVVTHVTFASIGIPREIDAYLNVNASITATDELAGYAEGGGNVTLELVSIEVLDSNTGELLRVSVTSASGHVYPVAQPPVPGLPALHVTGQSISQDSGSVMFSFASMAGASYRVMGSTDLGRTDPWQVMTTLPGQPGVSIATFTDPNATTQPSRFYKIERVAD